MNRIFLGLTIRGSCEAAWKLSRVESRGRQAHPQRPAHRVPGLGARPADQGTGSGPWSSAEGSRPFCLRTDDLHAEWIREAR